MRALFTLIKRQVVDNAVYFLAAIFLSAVLAVAILSITFSEDFLDLPLYTIILIITAPILFGIGGSSDESARLQLGNVCKYCPVIAADLSKPCQVRSCLASYR